MWYPSRACGTAINSSTTNNTMNSTTINWSHFKVEFTSQPNEDAEVHVLRINDWIGSHTYQGNVRVQRFYLWLVRLG